MTLVIWSKRSSLGHTAEDGEGRLQAASRVAHVLARIEAEARGAGVAEDDEERVALAPREPRAGEVDLRLVARERLEADERLRLGARAHLSDVVAELVTRRVPGGRSLAEAHGAEPGPTKPAPTQPPPTPTPPPPPHPPTHPPPTECRKRGLFAEEIDEKTFRLGNQSWLKIRVRTT